LHNKKKERKKQHAGIDEYYFWKIIMRRNNKYRTNKTIRFCQRCLQTSSHGNPSEQLSIDKRNRWKLMDLLKEYTQSPDYSNKIIVRRNYNFYQYNGYRRTLRENPPRHLSFARRPDFIYQPYVNFIKVNQDIFGLALRNGWKFLNNKTNLELLFDINSRNIPVTLIYFLDGPEQFCLSDWFHAWKHAFGGYFADYHTVCSGDYCPFGPKIRGEKISDSRINQVLFITGQNHESERCINCSCDPWKRAAKPQRPKSKKGRSKVKTQRREKYVLTKQARTAQILH
jgi:hypothetical protein